MEKLQEFTDAELAAELERRKTQTRKKELERRQRIINTIIQHRETLLALIPHSRTSCSDTLRPNSFGSADYGPRCARCALLELEETDAHEYDVSVTIQFHRVSN